MRVTPETKRRCIWAAGVVVLVAMLVIPVAWAASRRRTPLQYMVAGTLATSSLLAAAFVQLARRGYLDRRFTDGVRRAIRVTRRTAPENEQSS